MRWGVAAWVLVALIALTLVGIGSGLAMGFYVLPFLLGALAWFVFYLALRHQGYRNPLAPPELGPGERWDDGVPQDRSIEHELESIHDLDEMKRDSEAAEEHRHREDEERAEYLKHSDPHDFQGPPPFVPFP
jgi:hypothetical protein